MDITNKELQLGDSTINTFTGFIPGFRDPNKHLILPTPEQKHKGLRYNKGKLRYDLFHPYAIEQLAKIFTMGAEKYAPRNWENGMSWTAVIASLKRHLAAIESGEDFDAESGLLHSAHVEWNAHVLSAYYKIYPQGDDRPHTYLNQPKIGLDIDGVLADFTGYLLKVGGIKDHVPQHWNCPVIRELFEEYKHDKQFWLNIPPLIKSKDLGFEPTCYISARSIGEEVCKEWLDKWGFPTAKIYVVGNTDSKVEIAKKAGIDIFIDDHFNNFVELNKAGVCTLLYSAPYNLKYNVGHKRINNFTEFKERYL